MVATTLRTNQLRIADGWTEANETWTYASASTITVPTGAASRYQKGDRIKWTQTTVKYGVIVAVADTLLTIAVNTDYTVANAAISANYYSHQANPIGYPKSFNYACTNTPGSGSITTQTVTGTYSIICGQCFVQQKIVLTTNGTGAVDFRTNLPITDDLIGYSAYAIDATSIIPLFAGLNIVNGSIDTRTTASAYPGVNGHTYFINATYFF